MLTNAKEEAGRLVRAWAPFIVPTSAGAAIFAFQPVRAPISWDEAATVEIATRTVPQIVETAKHMDGVIAPYYLFMHFWTAAFGDSMTAFRAPSIIAMTAAMGVVGMLGRRLFNWQTGVLAGTMVAIIPNISLYAHEARPYALAFLFIALATLFLYRVLDSPHWTGWLLYGVTLLACVYLHLLALLVLLPHVIVVLRARTVGVMRFGAIGCAVAVIALPLVVFGNRQRTDQLDWIQPSRFRDMVLEAPGLILGGVTISLLLLVLALAAFRRERYAELLAFAFLPALALIVASHWFLSSPIWVPRYALYSVIPLCLLASATLAAGMNLRRLRIPAMIGLVVLLSVVAEPKQVEIRRIHWPSPDSRTIAEIIASHAAPGDGLAFAMLSWTLRPSVYYYLKKDLPTDHLPVDVLLKRTAADVAELGAWECTDPAPCLASTDRVWLVKHELADEYPTRVMAALNSDFDVRQAWRLEGTSVLLYERSYRPRLTSEQRA